MHDALQTLRLMEAWRKGERQQVLLATFRAWYKRFTHIEIIVGDEYSDAQCMQSLQRVALAAAAPALDSVAALEALDYTLRNHTSCILPSHKKIAQRVDAVVEQLTRSKQRAGDTSTARSGASSGGSAGSCPQS